MASKTSAKSALPYIERLLEDDYVQEQLRNAAVGLRAAYLRAREQRSRAAQDKRLYRSLRQAATAVSNATTALQRPKPQPKRRVPRIAAIAVAAGAGAWLTMKMQKAGPERTSGPDAPAVESESA